MFDVPAPHPNVLIILADDQGWGDLSINGNSNLSTPNIDSLARTGAILEHFYVCPVCSPTRAEFLTGRYHPRGGVHGVSTGGERLNLDETTIADIFKAAHYATGAFGKWHNGSQWPYHPNARGFDEYYGFTSGHWGSYFSPTLEHNGKLVQGKGFIIDDLTDHALHFIEQNKKRPFFCYVPFNTPHSPMQVPDRFYRKFANLDLKLRARNPAQEDVAFTRAALAMCENIDWNVGRILDRLDALKLADNTILIYFSDNGPNSWRWNGGMKGRKGSTDEGGVREPFLIRWPGHIPAGLRIPQIAAAIDLLPTLVDMAGVAAPSPPRSGRGIKGEVSLAPDFGLPDLRSAFDEGGWTLDSGLPMRPLDGLSLKPLLIGEGTSRPLAPGDPSSLPSVKNRMIFSHWNGKVSVRTQRYRLDDNGKLFDMETDPGQDHDISPQQKDETDRLSKARAEWKAELLPGLENDTRPFTVGYREFPITMLPARDGVPHGQIRRSASAPNCSYFKNWTSTNDSITWDIQVATPGTYDAVIYYTCPKTDIGSTIELSFNNDPSSSPREARAGRGPRRGDSNQSKNPTIHQSIRKANDPPLLGAENDRVPREGESYVKDFKPLRLGTIRLEKGRGTLALRALAVPGKQVMDVRAVQLTLAR